MFWGFSEAINFYDELKERRRDSATAPIEELNILLYGNTDCRHVLKTLAKSYQHNVKVNFYLVDGCIEIIARNMLLLAVALEPPSQMTIKAKTHLFMDLYGNSLLRPFSYNYMASKSTFLRRLITNSEDMENLAPIFSINNLKYRERDGLENAFNFWQPSEKHIFKIKDYWQQLNRNKLGVRFDYRKGAFDWDLQMALKDKGAQQICSQEYQYWRETGVAFTFPEYEQSNPNKSLAAALLKQGQDYSHRGYVGDFEVGPYCAFGLSNRNEKLSKSFHGKNDYRATDLTEANLFEMFYEIERRQELPVEEINCHKYGNIVLAMSELLEGCATENILLKKYDSPLVDCPKFRIHFLSIDETLEIPKGGKYTSFFDYIFVANNYFEFVKGPFINALKSGGCVYFETRNYSLWKKEATAEFLKRIKDLAKDVDLKPITNFNINANYPVVKYQK